MVLERNPPALEQNPCTHTLSATLPPNSGKLVRERGRMTTTGCLHVRLIGSPFSSPTTFATALLTLQQPCSPYSSPTRLLAALLALTALLLYNNPLTSQQLCSPDTSLLRLYSKHAPQCRHHFPYRTACCRVSCRRCCISKLKPPKGNCTPNVLWQQRQRRGPMESLLSRQHSVILAALILEAWTTRCAVE